MRVHIGDNLLVAIRRQKTFHFNLPKNVGKSLKYQWMLS